MANESDTPGTGNESIKLVKVTTGNYDALIDLFGWLGAEKAPFGWQKFVGLALMIGGIILFKWRTIKG